MSRCESLISGPLGHAMAISQTVRGDRRSPTLQEPVRPATAFVVEDEPLGRNKLLSYLRGTSWLECVGEAADGRRAIPSIDQLRPTLVFLDIELPDMSGLEVLCRTRHRPAVIFTTAYDRFAVRAFEVGALDYLLKPFGRQRFDRALSRARPMLDGLAGETAPERAQDAFATGSVERLFVRDGSTVLPLPVAAIERLEASDDCVRVHASGNVYRVNLLLSDLEQDLHTQGFVRVHRSHIVNLDFVAAFEGTCDSRIRVRLKSGDEITASRQRSRELRHLRR